MDTRNLLNYQKNVTSQCGEDGIIEEICARLDIGTGFFVEFGAWDGIHCSNTYNLLAKNWQGVYIEGDEKKYVELNNTRNRFPRQIISICAYVRCEGSNTLDNILAQTPTPVDLDLMSIDIDSYDWQVWYSLLNYHPTIVVIEGNSTVLPGIWQTHQEGVVTGSSFTALVALGESKGYKLVCHTGNLIFVRKEFIDKLNLNPLNLAFPETLFNYPKYLQEMEYQKRIKPQSCQP